MTADKVRTKHNTLILICHANNKPVNAGILINLIKEFSNDRNVSFTNGISIISMFQRYITDANSKSMIPT